MVPYLERTLDLSREYSSYFAPCKHVADPHIDDSDEGMTAASIGKLFGELKLHLVPMVRAICEMQRVFAEQLSDVPLSAFHRAINKVAKSLIRTEADELTYNLHIMLRFDLELKMLEGKLRVRDLPEAWSQAMQADLGIAPSDDRDGCLQDAHWYSGYIGGRFQSYAIGNILAAQFHAAALKTHRDIPNESANGAFGTLHTWLRNNVYRHGSKFAPNDLVERATGAAMIMTPYFGYLGEKYGALYRL